MKRILKNILVVAIMCLIFSSTVCAKQYINKDNFDYDWYLEKHPDLAAIVSADDKDSIWEFYVNIGEPAGWIGRVAKETLISVNDFDYERYAYENPDVVAVLGGDNVSLYQHYTTYGINEGRKGYVSQTARASLRAELMIYDLADTITADCKTDREKVKAVHDWLVKNVKYDYDNYLSGTIPYSSYRIEGAMLEGKAVCQGYAEAFELFMNVLGIPCELISGTGNNGSGTWVNHAWNKVYLDGRWYYIDTTWDDPVPDSGNSVYWYKYYLVTDPTFGGDHRPAN
jgi:hypothetical protein